VRLLVLGGGPAGSTAALQARELGADVTLLEAEQVGGTSLNHGPAPVRTRARRGGGGRARRGGGGRRALAIASWAAVSRSPRTAVWQAAQRVRWRSKLFRSGPASASST